MTMSYLIDTDVLIDYLRDLPDAVNFIEKIKIPTYITAISVTELYAGVREGKERIALDNFIKAFQIITIDKEIAQKGGLFRRDFGKSHNVGLADAIIAAATEYIEATLVTLNQKHFPMLSDIYIPYKKI